LPIVGNQVGRRDVCPGCGDDLHSCLNCRHYDPNVAKACKEPFAEVPSNHRDANFCEFFQIGEGGIGGRSDLNAAVSAAEALFKKR